MSNRIDQEYQYNLVAREIANVAVENDDDVSVRRIFP